ncbi:MAG: hypothetical protein ACRCTQ_00235 [Brevinemataceae bacterium]
MKNLFVLLGLISVVGCGALSQQSQNLIEEVIVEEEVVLPEDDNGNGGEVIPSGLDFFATVKGKQLIWAPTMAEGEELPIGRFSQDGELYLNDILSGREYKSTFIKMVDKNTARFSRPSICVPVQNYRDYKLLSNGKISIIEYVFVNQEWISDNYGSDYIVR